MGAGHQIDLESTDSPVVDTYMFLLSGAGTDGSVWEFDDDDGPGLNSQIVRELSAESYTVEATTLLSGTTGNFTVTIQVTAVPPPECTVTSLGAITSTVTQTGSWSSDCMSVNRTGKYAQFYSFSVSGTTDVQIDVESTDVPAVDTYMYLISGGEKDDTVLEFDDDGGESRNSQITRTLSAGTYTVEATTYSAARTGNFTLTMVLKLDPPTNLSLAVNASDDDQLDVTYSQSGESTHRYEFDLFRSDSELGTYTSIGPLLDDETATDSTSPASFDNQAKGKWYKARGRNCRTFNPSPLDCGDWTDFTSPIELPFDIFTFTPSPLALGDTSDVWTVDAASVYVDVDFSIGVYKDTSAGVINVHRVNSSGTVLDTLEVDNEDDSKSLSDINVVAGSLIRIDVDNDAFDANIALVTLTFHSGSGTSGDVIATATVQKEARPSMPLRGNPPVDVDQTTGSITLKWLAGTNTNANPHHFKVSIPTASMPYTADNIPNATLEHVIADGWAAGMVGTHNALISHCNAAGGCSLPLVLTFILGPPLFDGPSFGSIVSNGEETEDVDTNDAQLSRICLDVDVDSQRAYTVKITAPKVGGGTQEASRIEFVSINTADCPSLNEPPNFATLGSGEVAWIEAADPGTRNVALEVQFGDPVDGDYSVTVREPDFAFVTKPTVDTSGTTATTGNLILSLTIHNSSPSASRDSLSQVKIECKGTSASGLQYVGFDKLRAPGNAALIASGGTANVDIASVCTGGAFSMGDSVDIVVTVSAVRVGGAIARHQLLADSIRWPFSVRTMWNLQPKRMNEW